VYFATSISKTNPNQIKNKKNRKSECLHKYLSPGTKERSGQGSTMTSLLLHFDPGPTAVWSSASEHPVASAFTASTVSDNAWASMTTQSSVGGTSFMAESVLPRNEPTSSDNSTNSRKRTRDMTSLATSDQASTSRGPDCNQ